MYNSAEHDMKLFKEYNTLLTNDENEMQVILKVVETNRKLCPTKQQRSLLLMLYKTSTRHWHIGLCH